MGRAGLRPHFVAVSIFLLTTMAPPRAGGEELKAPVYTGPEGWRIALARFLDKDRAGRIARAVETLQQNGEFPGTCKLVKLKVREGGEWVVCEVMDFAGCRLEIWKDTRLVITLKSGVEVKSLAIVASVDAMQTMLLDNRVRPFVVTEKSVYGRRGPSQLAVKIDAPVKPEEVKSIRFEGVVAKCE